MSRRWLLVVLAATAVAVFAWPPEPREEGCSAFVTDGKRRVRLCLLVADTSTERSVGLMGRSSLRPFDGMLFVFDAPRQYGFWMYQTRVPLDLVPLAADGALREPLHMAPCPASAGRSCPSYTPVEPYERALELPAGWLDSHDLQPGAGTGALLFELGRAACPARGS